MKATGIVRHIDRLGRFVIPKELRKIMKIDIGAPLEVFVEKDSIILKKYKKESNSLMEKLSSVEKDFEEICKQLEEEESQKLEMHINEVRKILEQAC